MWGLFCVFTKSMQQIKAQHVTLYERQARETIWTDEKFLQQVLTAWCIIIIMPLQDKWELEQWIQRQKICLRLALPYCTIPLAGRWWENDACLLHFLWVISQNPLCPTPVHPALLAQGSPPAKQVINWSCSWAWQATSSWFSHSSTSRGTDKILRASLLSLKWDNHSFNL